MLFSSIVFMNRTFRGHWTSVVLIFVLKLDVALNKQIPHENAEKFDSDFGNFLRDLGSLVYKTKRTDVTQNELRPSTYTTPSIKSFRRNRNSYNTQRAILEDVLMMKLVSYYEDKYKLSHSDSTTVENIAPTNVFTKTNALTKNNAYDYNVIDKEEVLNGNPKITKQQYGLNRRLQKEMKRMDEYQVPEVVIF